MLVTKGHPCLRAGAVSVSEGLFLLGGGGMILLEDSRAGLSKAFGRPDDNRETALSQTKKTFLLFSSLIWVIGS